MTPSPTPRVALFQDLSGVGRCALTVALPVLSVMGAQCCPAPTVVLSSHTGGFPGVARLGAGDFPERAIRQWTDLQLPFDAVYAGYLAEKGQAESILSFVRSQENPPLFLVDPVMADHGKLYAGMPEGIEDSLRNLADAADILTPNPTEAAFLTGIPYSNRPKSRAQIWELMNALTELGARCAIVTGLPVGGGLAANVMLRAGWEKPLSVPYRPLPVAYPGTGDLFASVFLGAKLRGEADEMALRRATMFAYRAIVRTLNAQSPSREGVLFEDILGDLIAQQEVTK